MAKKIKITDKLYYIKLTYLSEGIMKGFSEEMAFEHKQQIMIGVNNEKIWGRGVSDRGSNRYKGPQTVARWYVLRNTKKAIMAGAK